jgi:hypothetical protein
VAGGAGGGPSGLRQLLAVQPQVAQQLSRQDMQMILQLTTAHQAKVGIPGFVTRDVNCYNAFHTACCLWIAAALRVCPSAKPL